MSGLWLGYIICFGKNKKSHTCEEGGAHLSFFLAFIDELEKQIIIKKTKSGKK